MKANIHLFRLINGAGILVLFSVILCRAESPCFINVLSYLHEFRHSSYNNSLDNNWFESGEKIYHQMGKKLAEISKWNQNNRVWPTRLYEEHALHNSISPGLTVVYRDRSKVACASNTKPPRTSRLVYYMK
jgi:hypothetical protein